MRFDDIRQAWDTSFKSTGDSDYVCGVLVGIRGADVYVLHAIHGRMSSLETQAAIEDMTAWAKEHLPPPHGYPILVEDAANGAAIVEVLRSEIGGIKTVGTQGGKMAHAHVASARFGARQVFFPGAENHDSTSFDPSRTSRWVQDFIVELEMFPNGTRDDRVDVALHPATSIFGTLVSPPRRLVV